MDATLTTDPTTTSSTTTTRLPERFAQIPLRLLQESPHNPRTHFDQAKLIELGESIQAKGIIEPLVVREFDTAGDALSAIGGYEIVAGARRFRAAKLAGLETVPCIVRDYSDDDALEIFVIENLQRDDLSPLEQARGFKQLLTANADRFSVATIASKVGMSPAWVWDRLKLLDLVPEAQTLLETGRITVGHAIVLARLKAADQERAIDPDTRGGLWEQAGETLDLEEASYDADPYQDVKPRSIRELEAWVANHVRFDVQHMAQAVPLDFEEVAQRVEQAQQEPGRGKKVISITYNHFTPPEARDDADRTYGPQSWRRADGAEGSSVCDHAVLGLVVVGPKQGRAFEVCIAHDRCEVHFAEEVKAKQKAAKARAKGDTKTATKVEKRQEQSWEQQERKRKERAAIWEPMKPHVCQAAVDQLKRVTALTPRQAKHFEETEFYISTADAKKVLGAKWFEQLAAAALISEVMTSWADSYEEFVKRVAEPLGLDMKPLLAARDAHSPAPAAAATPAKKGKGRK